MLRGHGLKAADGCAVAAIVAAGVTEVEAEVVGLGAPLAAPLVGPAWLQLTSTTKSRPSVASLRTTT